MMQSDSCVYAFSDAELKQLALFFRHCGLVPDVLLPLNAFAENYVYEAMTIEEAELFFTER